MATNSNYDLAKKTTKLVRGIHSWIKFQKHQGVESITIQGKDTLADVSQDKNGDTNLILMADVDKLNSVTSNVPYLGFSHAITGEDPDKNKTAIINQDLTQFPLIGGELVTVTKETDSLTIHDEKVKEKLNNKINTVTSSVPFINVTYITTGTDPNQEKTAIISQDLTQFSLEDGELVTVTKSLNRLTIQDGQIKDFVNDMVTKKENDIRDFIGEVKTELTNKINEKSERFDEDFKNAVVNIIDNERPIYFLDDYFTFNNDNQFFVISNNDHGIGIDNIEIDLIHNIRSIDRLLLKSIDFVNKVYENEKMYIKLYKVGRVVDTGGNVIYSVDYYNPSEKGYLCLHVTLKEPINEGEFEKYSIYIKYYSKNPLQELLEMLPITGDGTRLTAESMTN